LITSRSTNILTVTKLSNQAQRPRSGLFYRREKYCYNFHFYYSTQVYLSNFKLTCVDFTSWIESIYSTCDLTWLGLSRPRKVDLKAFESSRSNTNPTLVIFQARPDSLVISRLGECDIILTRTCQTLYVQGAWGDFSAFGPFKPGE
jgi:hypothetical protein